MQRRVISRLADKTVGANQERLTLPLKLATCTCTCGRRGYVLLLLVQGAQVAEDLRVRESKCPQMQTRQQIEASSQVDGDGNGRQTDCVAKSRAS
jgi:hypothetical protein